MFASMTDNVLTFDTALTAVAVLLALFGLLALLRGRMGAALRPHAVSFHREVQPTGSVSSLTAGLPVFWKDMPPSPQRELAPAPAIEEVPGGPVVIAGSKYMWESRWSHLPSFEQGREGEERVVNTLMNTLGSGWYIFRNFVLPSESEDIDLVLVGPGGIYAIEVKTFTGDVKVERGRWYVKTAGRRVTRQRRGPNGQARRNAIKLNTFLKEHGIGDHNYVKPLVVLSGDGKAHVISSGTGVLTPDGLRAFIKEEGGRQALTPNKAHQIAGVLQAAACEQVRSGLSRVH